MSRLSELALSRRSVTLLLTVALFIAGVAAWGSLKQELLPDASFPIVTIVAPFPGAGATDVTELVTKPIERAVTGVPNLDQLQSTSANSFAFVIAQFEYGADLDASVAAIEENLRSADLPDSVEPSVSSFNFNSAPVVIAAVSAPEGGEIETATEIARSEIVPELLSLPGVAAADLAGGLEDQLLVTLDPDALAATGVSEEQVARVLQANNLTIPSGEIAKDGTEIPVTTIGRFTSVEEIENVVVGVRTSGPIIPIGPSAPPTGPATPTPITIGEVGTVELASLPTTGFARTNGQPSVTISVVKSGTANTVAVAEDVQATLDEIAAGHEGEIEIVTISDQSSFILESSEGLLREGGLGALFAVLTIFLFLFNVRSTLVAAVSIPLSILTALVIMQVTGITLNILTLGGLAVAVGRVVDDSIVVLENTFRHRALGDDRLTAAIAGPREVAGAITASTVTTIAVFLPLGFAGGFVSQFFLSFSLTITFALVASLVIALTVVPVFGYFLIGRVNETVDEMGEPRNSLWVRVYDPAIRLVLRNRWTKIGTVIGAAALFFLSTALVPLLPTTFINTGSEKIVQVAVQPPPGAATDDVWDRSEEAETILLDDPDVVLVAASIPGEGDVGFQTLLAAQFGRPTNSSTIFVRLEPAVDLAEKITELTDALAPVARDGYEVTVGQQAGATSNNLSIIVSAEDAEVVATTTDAVLAALEDEPDLANLSSDLAAAAPEVQVVVDPNRAIGVGLTAAQVGGEIRATLVPQTLGQVRLDDADPVDFVLQLDPETVTSVEDLRSLPVGVPVPMPLQTIADVDEVDVQGRITRIDGAPAATISAEITSGDTGATSMAVEAVIDDLAADGSIPSSADVSLSGVTAQQAEAFSGLFSAMGVAILLVYLTMVLTFNSLTTPFVILFSLPLATIGAFPALLITDRPIGLSALLGFLMLIGIVVTNAIVLLDLVVKLRSDGHPTDRALVMAGHTRVRPILMTALATILALVPLAAGFNEGSIIAAELGTVVIGGLLSSTFLTLLVIPAIYSLIEGLKDRLSRRSKAVAEPAQAEPAPST